MVISQPIILVIDDQPGIRNMLTEVFKDQGYSVITAANGYEGIQIAVDSCPDVILMDMKMPGMNGIDVLKELKRQDQCHKVIVMTAYEDVETLKEALDVGVRDYVIKPFDIIALGLLIEKSLKDFSFLNSKRLMIG